MGFPSLTRWMPKIWSFASRIVMHPRSPEAHSVFGTGALLLCQPSEMVRVGRSCTCDLLVPNPEIGCQGWTRTNTERLNRPPCYFDTTWQWLIGAAGRTSTCIVPLRRRMPDVFDHGSNLRMVGTAGFPPAASRSQAGRSED